MLGELDEGERAQFEAHFFDCRECENEVMVASALVDGVRSSEPIRARTTELPAHATGERVFVVPIPPEVTRPDWLDRSGLRLLLRALGEWPRAAQVAGATALLLFGVTGAQTLVILPELRQELALRDRPRALAPVPLRAATRGEPPAIDLQADDRTLALALAVEPGGSYEVRLVKAEGEAGLPPFTVAGPRPGEPLELVLPASRLERGRYLLELIRAGQTERFAFDLRLAHR